MDVRCERCATEYELDDDSVPAGGCPVQCTTCGHTFPVHKAQAASGGETLPSPPAADWLLETSDGRLHRFRNLTSLQKWIIERKVTREDKISRTGQAWRRLGEIVELAPFFDVVDEADRARAGQAGLQTEDLKAEAQRARRQASARPTPVPGRSSPASGNPAVRAPTPTARHASPSQELASVDAWAASVPVDDDEGGEFDTSVVPQNRRGLKVTAGLLIVAAAAAAVFFLVEHFGAAGKVSPGLSALQATPVAEGNAKPEPPPQPSVALPEPAEPPPANPLPSPTTVDQAPPQPADPVAAAPSKTKPEALEVSEPPVSFDKLVSDADRLLENGATDRAVRLYERALKLQPNGVDALTGMAYASLDKERLGLAVAYFERALSQAPSYGPALFGLAESLRAQGQEGRALEGYRRYLQVNASGVDAPAARRQLRLLEDKMGAAEAGRPPVVPPSGPPPSPSSVLNETEAP